MLFTHFTDEASFRAEFVRPLLTKMGFFGTWGRTSLYREVHLFCPANCRTGWIAAGTVLTFRILDSSPAARVAPGPGAESQQRRKVRTVPGASDDDGPQKTTARVHRDHHQPYPR